MQIIERIHLVECPRDAMQGWKKLILTRDKIDYINALLKVGFDTIDFGSFVSPKAIPQMADTKAVLKELKIEKSSSKLLAIVANTRGAEEAVLFDAITYLGFPFSVSETFQQKNTNGSIEEALKRVEEIQSLCVRHRKQLVVYLSMGFGNPYGDPYSEDLVLEWGHRLANMGINILSLADTVGVATPQQVFSATKHLIQELPRQQIGVHLHSSPHHWQEKAAAALQAGCRRFDGALKGIGGCPIAGDELVGNMDTAKLIAFFDLQQLLKPINQQALEACKNLAEKIFT
jgi:hydroxymethylglutaryl-CoA lyase